MSPCSGFDHLIKLSTLKIIYGKFKAATFTTADVVTKVYWLGCIKEHVRYMQRKGWIVKVNDTQFRFVVPVEDWQFGGEVH